MNKTIKSAINQLSSNVDLQKKLQKQYNVITNSNLFDEQYYQPPAEELALFKDKLSHYLNVGWKANLDPSPYFSGQYYLYKNPGVAKEKLNPLVHYIVYGEKEGRSPNVHFYPKEYLALNPDLAGLKKTLLLHYIEFGISEGRIFRQQSPLKINKVGSAQAK